MLCHCGSMVDGCPAGMAHAHTTTTPSTATTAAPRPRERGTTAATPTTPSCFKIMPDHACCPLQISSYLSPSPTLGSSPSCPLLPPLYHNGISTFLATPTDPRFQSYMWYDASQAKMAGGGGSCPPRFRLCGSNPSPARRPPTCHLLNRTPAVDARHQETTIPGIPGIHNPGSTTTTRQRHGVLRGGFRALASLGAGAAGIITVREDGAVGTGGLHRLL